MKFSWHFSFSKQSVKNLKDQTKGCKVFFKILRKLGKSRKAKKISQKRGGNVFFENISKTIRAEAKKTGENNP